MKGIKNLIGCKPVILFEPSHYWLSEVVVKADDIANLQRTILNNLVHCSREGKKCFNRVNNGSFEIIDLDENLRNVFESTRKTPKAKSKSSTSSRESIIIDNSPVKGDNTNVSKKSIVCVYVCHLSFCVSVCTSNCMTVCVLCLLLLLLLMLFFKFLFSSRR